MQAFIDRIDSVGSLDFSKDLVMKIHFSGCDFSCPCCNTPGLLETKSDQEMDLKEVKRDMVNQAGSIEGIFLTGGEPCFQKLAALEILRYAKDMKLRTILDTNGSKPEVVERMLKNDLLNTVIMDVKAPFNELFEKATKSQTFFKSSSDIMVEVKETLQVLKAYDEKVEIIFRTTIIPGLVYRKEDILEIAREIEGINCCWELRPFRSGLVKDKTLHNINSPTDNFLINLKEAIEKEITGMNVRISY